MPKYLETFESEAVGAIPSNWTRRFELGGGDTWEVVDDGGSPTDKTLRHTVDGDDLYMLALDTPVATGRGETQVLVKYKVSHASHVFGVWLRGSGTAGTEQGYRFSISSVWKTIQAYTGGGGGSSGLDYGVNHVADTWYWIRIQSLADKHYLRFWADGDTEPLLWDVRFEDDTIDGLSGANYIGLYSGHNSPGSPSSTCEISVFSVGTDGDAADLPDDEVGVRLTQSVAQAVTEFDAEMRVSQAFLQTSDALDSDTRVTQLSALALWGGLSDGIRCTQMSALVLATGNPCATRWAQCWSIARTDGTTYRFTTLDIDMTFRNNTYLTCGSLASTASENFEGLSESGNVELNAILNSSHISDQEVLSGLFDGAVVEAWVVPWEQLAGEHPFRILAGEIGTVRKGTVGFSADILTYAAKAQQSSLLDLYTASCRHNLGDSVCQVDVSALTVSGTVTGLATVVQPSVSRKRAFFDSSRGEAAGYFDFGYVTWTTGNNSGVVSQVETFGGDQSFLLWEATPYRIEAGDQYTASPGCNKTVDQCKTKFSNFVNYGGFPDIPGEDLLIGWRTKPTDVS